MSQRASVGSVLLCLSDEECYRAWSNRGAPRHCHRCCGVDLAIAVADPIVRVVVCELSRTTRSTGIAVGLIGKLDEHITLILRAELSPSIAREIIHLARTVRDVRVSLIGVDDLAMELQSFVAVEEQSHADAAIIRRIAHEMDNWRPEIFVAAAVAGRRRTQVVTLATMCAIPIRTLEWRLHAAGVLPARKPLGWMLSLHSVWRLDVLGWPLKRAAHAAGFSSSEGLGNYVSRHLGARPIELARSGFEPLLERFVNQLAGPWRDGEVRNSGDS